MGLGLGVRHDGLGGDAVHELGLGLGLGVGLGVTMAAIYSSKVAWAVTPYTSSAPLLTRGKRGFSLFSST